MKNHPQKLARRLAVAASAVVVAASACAPAPAPAVAQLSGSAEMTVFPLAIPIKFSDTWAAARSNGRTHEGQDLMAPKGTVAVAVVDGTITQVKHSNSGNAGNQVRLVGDNGWTYYYIHLNNDTPGTDDGVNRYDQAFADGIRVGQRVRAGEPIGFVGDSGNAESTSPHLHFESHAPGVGVVNPFAYLKAAPVAPIDITSTRPFGILDSVTVVAANTIRVSGWALAATGDDAVTYQVFVNGSPLASAVASTSRPDLSSAFPGRGPNHGFTLDVRGIVAGTHEVCVVLSNPTTGGGGRTNCGTVQVS